MDSSNVGDSESIHAMINNDALIKTLHKEELCSCLKNTKLNFTESSYIFQQIKSKYGIADRFEIIRSLSIDFGEKKNFDISKILDLLKIFGQCIEWDTFNSIVEIIESGFSRLQQRNNKYIDIVRAAYKFRFDQIYCIFNKIADENDTETMSFAINEELHRTKKWNDDKDIFTYSLEKSNLNLIRLMIEYGVDYTQHLSTITKKLNTEMAKYFFKIPHFDGNKQFKYNDLALRQASRYGHQEVVKLLLTVPGIDINAKDNDYNAALITASNWNCHEVVKLLLSVPGIDVNAKDDYNDTALIYASKKGHHEVVKLLISVPGIDVNAKGMRNKTALIYASENGHQEVVKLLLTVPGIDVNAKNSDNNTALYYASWYGHHEVVKLLISVPGIDVNAKCYRNKTALKCASRNGHQEVVKLLLSVPGILHN